MLDLFPRELRGGLTSFDKAVSSIIDILDDPEA